VFLFWGLALPHLPLRQRPARARELTKPSDLIAARFAVAAPSLRRTFRSMTRLGLPFRGSKLEHVPAILEVGNQNAARETTCRPMRTRALRELRPTISLEQSAMKPRPSARTSAQASWLLALLTALGACAAKKGAKPAAMDAGNAPTSEGASAQQPGANSDAGSAVGADPTAPTQPPNPGSPTPAAPNDGNSSSPVSTTSAPDQPALPQAGDLGAYPFVPSPATRGGTMTFTNVGAPGSWPRRLDRESGDPACDYKDGTDTWGGQCCMTEHHSESTQLAPFDEEMTLILKAINVKQLAVYQPTMDSSAAPWSRVTGWNGETGASENLWFTREGDGSSTFPGDLTHDDCVGYVSQAPLVDCSDADYYCPNDPGILHHGFKGSKLVVFLGSMMFDDAGVAACNGDGAGHPGPWVAFVASELIRDGGRKWNGLCNCYSKTGSVGDGCGEINVFEVVMDNNAYSNREFASTGVRSYQAGHVGGSVCGEDCDRDAFPVDVEVVDACAQSAYTSGPELAVGGDTDGCPVWRRPNGDRYFFILLDETQRKIQIGIVHPSNIPSAASGLLPQLPQNVDRTIVDAMLDMRLPE
jgi:hypothetical protein